jgi:type II secretory ATPase GspE/PulE/Tfp pilus assembly ATPase PilB-like protein
MTTESNLFPPIPFDVPPEEVVSHCVRVAAASKVSDLFFAMHENHVSVSVRHLGFMRLVTIMPLDLGRRCITHIKVSAGMDVAERRRPQDGRWVRDLNETQRIDLRISTIPTLYGEDLAIRLLIREFGLLDLEELGLMQRNLNQLVDMLSSPSGLILVTGPTGSGKTTTLYACLKHLNNGFRKINTIEDPIEYAIEGIRQSQINYHVEVDFPELLRAVLRQAPDIIMIGEIRDPVTAETAVRAANSGHLVLATLHAPISAGAIQSMISLGVHPHFLSSSLRGVMAQRLVRTLCPKCKEPFDLSYAPQTFDEVKPFLEPGEGGSLFVARGCNECLQTGYAARTGIFETLPITAPIRQMILDREPTQVIRDKGLEEGLIEMRQVALVKVARGMTTVEELLRVIPVEFLGLTG